MYAAGEKAPDRVHAKGSSGVAKAETIELISASPAGAREGDEMLFERLSSQASPRRPV